MELKLKTYQIINTMKRVAYRFAITILMVLSFAISSMAQGSYVVFLQDTLDEAVYRINSIKDNSFIAIRDIQCPKINHVCENGGSVIYTFSNETVDDSIQWQLNLKRQDTLIRISHIIQEDNFNYILFGVGYLSNVNDSILKRIDYISKFDENRNLLWERFYERPNEVSGMIWETGLNTLKLKSSGYLTANTISSSPVVNQMYVREYGSNGDSITSRLFSTYIRGYVQDLIYNRDSTKILLHTGFSEIPDCDLNIGAFMLDTLTYDTIGSICYMNQNTCTRMPFDATINENGNLLVCGTGRCSGGKEYIFAHIYDTAYILFAEQYLTDPDTLTIAGSFDNMRINNEGEICIAGTFNDIPAQWPMGNNWIYVAKLDQELNLLNERYYGGDTYYTTFSMTACEDGGIAVGGMCYDYMINDHEHDAFIIKTDAGLMVNTTYNTIIPQHSAIVYPNPGTNSLNIRTMLRDVTFTLYDITGQEILSKNINELVTNINTVDCTRGVYLWTIDQHGVNIEKGKWIKLIS